MKKKNIVEVEQEKYDAVYSYKKRTDLPAIFKIIEDASEDISLRRAAVSQLGWIKDSEDEITPYLLNLLNKEEFKNEALNALARIGSKDGFPIVIKEIVESQDSWTRRTLANDLRENSKWNWNERADEVIEIIKSLKINAGDIDSLAIINAIRISDYPEPKNQDPVIDYLIGKSIGQEGRMIGIFAKLIIEICDRNQLYAGQKVKEYEKVFKIQPDKLRDLRIAIGGEIALDPLLSILKNNLDENFQKPIAKLNKDTRNMWQKTIRYAQYGFTTRMAMSVIVFLVGIFLLILSSWEILFEQIKSEQIFGVGVSFITGLGMMLTIVYRGPLKEIRKSVNDLGIASAAFIAYVHRVLEISHTFSYYYLNQKITFSEMTNSSKLIDEAMNNTVGLLSTKEADSE